MSKCGQVETETTTSHGPWLEAAVEQLWAARCPEHGIKLQALQLSATGQCLAPAVP